MSSVGPDVGNADLVAERDRLLYRIENTARAKLEDAALPDAEGVYVVWPVNHLAVADLGLRDVAGESFLADRPLYIGKAEDSVSKRLTKHFSSGDTGRSTLRRTLASLLDLESRPRRTSIVNPTPKQVRILVTNFDLAERDDDHLTRWMVQHLEVCGVASTFSSLKKVERALGAELRPPLDQERPPMWRSNPWRDHVADRRQALRERARLHL
jgi:hypothetical protein